MKLPALLSILVVSSASFAGEACDKPKNDFDGLYCLNRVYQEADRELNSNFKVLTTLLDGPGRTQLKQTQLAWQKMRNAKCSRREESTFWVDLQCATDTTISQAQFLQDRIRECKSSGCMNSKL